MKIILTTTAFALLVLAVKDTEGSSAVEKIKADYKAAIVKRLEALGEGGKTYTKEEVEEKLKGIISEEGAKLGPELRKLGEEGKDPALAANISKEVLGSSEVQQAFKKLIGGDVAPRFVGALVMGVTQLSTDVVKMGLTRY